MKIAIIGTGGVGGYFGGKLANAGYDVTFLARGEHLNALHSSGLMIKSILGDFFIKNPKATDTIKDIPSPDLVLVCLKAWQLKDIALELSHIIKRETLILPLQNGVVAFDELNTAIPDENILGGSCRIISKIESPGVINHFGVDPLITFGPLSNIANDRLHDVKKCFDGAGINSKISKDIQSDLWKKFISICVSGLLAVTRSTYGEIREIRETREMMIALLNEIYLLSQKIGIQIETDYVEKTVAYIDAFPYESTSSLARDVWEGKPSEIEYQNGTVVKLAQKYGVDVPVNRFIYNSILPMETKARKQK